MESKGKFNFYRDLLGFYGIGYSRSTKLLGLWGIGLRGVSFDEDLHRLMMQQVANSNYVGSSLKFLKQKRLHKLRDRGIYRGLRLRDGLPANGQRSKTNGRTAKVLRVNLKGGIVAKKKVVDAKKAVIARVKRNASSR